MHKELPKTLAVIKAYLSEMGFETEPVEINQEERPVFDKDWGFRLFHITPTTSHAISIWDGSIVVEIIGDPYAERAFINLSDPDSLGQLIKKLTC